MCRLQFSDKCTELGKLYHDASGSHSPAFVEKLRALGIWQPLQVAVPGDQSIEGDKVGLAVLNRVVRIVLVDRHWLRNWARRCPIRVAL